MTVPGEVIMLTRTVHWYHAAVLAAAVAALAARPAPASTCTFSTPTGAKDKAGETVSANAVVTTANGQITVTLQNLLVNQKSIGQNISGVYITLGTAPTGSP